MDNGFHDFTKKLFYPLFDVVCASYAAFASDKSFESCDRGKNLAGVSGRIKTDSSAVRAMISVSYIDFPKAGRQVGGSKQGLGSFSPIRK